MIFFEILDTNIKKRGGKSSPLYKILLFKLFVGGLKPPAPLTATHNYIV